MCSVLGIRPYIAIASPSAVGCPSRWSMRTTLYARTSPVYMDTTTRRMSFQFARIFARSTLPRAKLLSGP